MNIALHIFLVQALGVGSQYVLGSYAYCELYVCGVDADEARVAGLPQVGAIRATLLQAVRISQ